MARARHRIGKDLPDTIEWSKFATAAWLPSNDAFIYERYPTPASGQAYKGALYGQTVYLHKLGTPQSADTLLYSRPDHKNWLFGAGVTEDGRYIPISVGSNESINNRFGTSTYADPKHAFHQLLWKNDAQWSYVDNVGPLFYFTTTLNSPNTRIVAIDVRHPQKMTTVIPESKWSMSNASAVGRRFILSYLVDAHSSVKVYDYKGKFVRDVALPGLGMPAVSAVSRPTRRRSTRTRAGLRRRSIFVLRHRFGQEHGLSQAARSRSTPPTTRNQGNLLSEQRRHAGADVDLVPQGPASSTAATPTILYGYGGFDIPMTPYFSTSIATWLEMGGVYAVANIARRLRIRRSVA